MKHSLLILCLLILGLGGILLKPLSSKTTNLQPLAPEAPKKIIKVYPNEVYGFNNNWTINNIHIISYLFIPKNIDRKPKEEWYKNMNLINQEIEKFYEKEFEGNINITYEVIDHPILGNKNIEEYVYWDIAKEGLELTESNSKPGEVYNLRMLYFVRDEDLKRINEGGNLGGVPDLKTATQYEFWLDDKSVKSQNPYGIIGSAHEFGHALGMKHSWEIPSPDPAPGQKGDIMGYNNNNLKLEQTWIREDVKKLMGL